MSFVGSDMTEEAGHTLLCIERVGLQVLVTAVPSDLCMLSVPFYFDYDASDRISEMSLGRISITYLGFGSSHMIATP